MPAATKGRTRIASTLRYQYSAASFPALAPGVLHPPDPLPRPGTPTTGALARPQHCGIRLFIDQGPASPAWRRVSSLRCGPRRRDRRVNCSTELAELVGQELPLVLEAAVAGVGGCRPGGDVKAGLIGGTGPWQGSQRPRRGRRVVRRCRPRPPTGKPRKPHTLRRTRGGSVSRPDGSRRRWR